MIQHFNQEKELEKKKLYFFIRKDARSQFEELTEKLNELKNDLYYDSIQRVKQKMINEVYVNKMKVNRIKSIKLKTNNKEITKTKNFSKID